MDTTSRTNPPDLDVNEHGFDVPTTARNYGIVLGVLTAAYLIVLNLLSAEPSIGARFAKHLLIIPILWMAIAAYAAKLPDGKVFKNEIGYVGRIAGWAAVTLILVNVLFFGITGTSFEQFMQEGQTFAGVMVNSGFLLFETIVFVMIIGFVILQAFKGKGSPED